MQINVFGFTIHTFLSSSLKLFNRIWLCLSHRIIGSLDLIWKLVLVLPGVLLQSPTTSPLESTMWPKSFKLPVESRLLVRRRRRGKLIGEESISWWWIELGWWRWRKLLLVPSPTIPHPPILFCSRTRTSSPSSTSHPTSHHLCEGPLPLFSPAQILEAQLGRGLTPEIPLTNRVTISGLEGFVSP